MQAHEVEPGLFVSDWRVAASEETLRRLKVALVVNMAEEVDDPEPPSLLKSVRFAKFGIWDCGPEFLDYDQRALVVRNVHLAVDEIQAAIARGPVLVHCNAGLSRSPITAMAWLSRYRMMTWENAEKCVLERHPEARLHNQALRKYVQQWLPTGRPSSRRR